MIIINSSEMETKIYKEKECMYHMILWTVLFFQAEKSQPFPSTTDE
jgi:hypothetical protein